jgi:putative hydrolase of the HAD superfamily
VAERPVLEAVLLDAGGTLVRLDFEWMAEALLSLGCEAGAAGLRRAEIEGRRHYDKSRGYPPVPGGPSPPPAPASDIDAYFGSMLEAAGVPISLVPAALERFYAHHAQIGLWSRPMEGARETLAALNRLGLRCAVVSNSDGRAEEHLALGGVRDGLEFIVDSQLVGVEKPDPRIFALALERLGLPAARVLFVGDIRSVDEAGARAAGVHFVLLDPYGDYAAVATPAIPGIGDLPAWIEARFAIAAADGPGSPPANPGRSAPPGARGGEPA